MFTNFHFLKRRFMYPSNLSDQAWSEIEHILSVPTPGGPRVFKGKHTIVNAVLYVVKTGCQWRMLPHDFLPWQSVYDHYRRWNQRGVWQEVLGVLHSCTPPETRQDAFSELCHRRFSKCENSIRFQRAGH